MGSNTDTIQFNSTKTLSVPTKTHYTFEGWYIGNTQITTGNGKMLRNWSIANNDSVLTAKWEAVTYTISFANCETMSPIQVKYNTTITLPTPTSQYKYDTFISWSYGGNDYTNSFTMPGGNIVMTAQWNNNGWTYISTKDEFRNINNNLSGKYCLKNDVNLGEWNPIGSYEWAKGETPTSCFSGEFDGDNNVISYTINIPALNNEKSYGYGIFGSINNATIKNIEAKTSISGKNTGGTCSYIGGIVGWAKNSQILNCTTSGSITQYYVGDANYGVTRGGGIAGKAYSTTFKSCLNYAQIDTTSFNAYTAGICPGIDDYCTFDNCTNKGKLSASQEGWRYGSHEVYERSISMYKNKNHSAWGVNCQPWD